MSHEAKSPPPTVVLLYNSWRTTLDLVRLYEPYVSNIWLVDNNSPQDGSPQARQLFPQMRIIRLPTNGGWASGYNAALRLARDEGHDAAYLLNSDAVPEPGAIEAALEALGADERAAAVGSIVLSADGDRVEFDGRHHRAEPRPLAVDISTSAKRTDRVHGAGMAISIRAFTEVGPFCEAYFLYHEETDWMIRAMRAGWHLWVNGASRIRHQDGGSDSGHNALYYRIRNRFIALRRGVSLSGRKERLLTLLHDQWPHIHQDDQSAALAARQGLIDGLLRATGPRPKPWSPWAMAGSLAAIRLAVVLYALAQRPVRKLRSLASVLSRP